MTIDRRSVLLGGLTVGALGTRPICANAEDYPASNRPIKIVVPAAAGGGLDVAARLVAQKISDIWKQQTYVENRPGGNWIIGMHAVARSDPDGYTLLAVSNAGLSVNPLVFSNIPFDPFQDLTPIVAITRGTFVLLVHPSVPAKTTSEFISHLKANPGKLNHGVSSASTTLLSKAFRYLAKVDFVDVSYKGGARVVADAVAGTIQFCFSDLGSALGAIQSGQLRPLGIASATRYEIVPELAPISEQLPGFVMEGGVLLIAPAKTPRDILDKLNGVVRQALDMPDVKKRLRLMGNMAGGGTPEQVQEMLRNEAGRWKKLTKERNIRL